MFFVVCLREQERKTDGACKWGGDGASKVGKNREMIMMMLVMSSGGQEYTKKQKSKTISDCRCFLDSPGGNRTLTVHV